MKAINHKLDLLTERIEEGPYTRAEAGALIVRGTRHIHSHPTLKSGVSDPLVELTQFGLSQNTVPRYPWELDKPRVIELTCSKSRNAVLQNIFESKKGIKRDLNDKITMVFEELATNAIYHSYLSNSGKDKYSRSLPALLNEKEAVSVCFGWENNGLYLALHDKGGTLSFERLQDVFNRCYLGDKKNKIENKEGGAGLGLYMVFEAVTHLKVNVTVGVSTVVSCWLQEKPRHTEESFSFNFFSRKEQP